MKDVKADCHVGAGEGTIQARDTGKESVLMSSEKSPERLVSSVPFVHLV